MNLSLESLSGWLQGYFGAWRSNDPAAVARLFAPDAVYYYGPFSEPARGREEIVANWVGDSEGQSDVVCRFEALATHGDLGVAHWNVSYRSAAGGRTRTELDGILLLRFNEALECVEHREWYSRRAYVVNIGTA